MIVKCFISDDTSNNMMRCQPTKWQKSSSWWIHDNSVIMNAFWRTDFLHFTYIELRWSKLQWSTFIGMREVQQTDVCGTCTCMIDRAQQKPATMSACNLSVPTTLVKPCHWFWLVWSMCAVCGLHWLAAKKLSSPKSETWSTKWQTYLRPLFERNTSTQIKSMRHLLRNQYSLNLGRRNPRKTELRPVFTKPSSGEFLWYPETETTINSASIAKKTY